MYPFCCILQCLMLMEMLSGADGLNQLRVNVLVCARCFQLHLIRLAISCLYYWTKMFIVLFNEQ